MKNAFVISTLIITLAIITGIFWYNDWKYKLPTPVPKQYHAVSPGTYISLPDTIITQKHKPILLHFFNPKCPCSRFNIANFKMLVKQYSAQMNFAIVVSNIKNAYTVDGIKNEFDLDVPVSFDTSLARACGVYSTPQAVILDADQKLFYRGNYNKDRYCADKQTNYAQTAIDSLLNKRLNLHFNKNAFQSYGCQLPQNCTN